MFVMGQTLWGGGDGAPGTAAVVSNTSETGAHNVSLALTGTDSFVVPSKQNTTCSKSTVITTVLEINIVSKACQG